MAACHLSNIPSDIIDLIFEQISLFPDSKERSRTLVASSLVSWYFRHRAHARLFSEVYINNCADGNKLLELMQVDPDSGSTGMASYVNVLAVSLLGLENTIRPILDDGTLAAIMKRIFRSDHIRDCTLMLSIRARPEDPASSDDPIPFDWQTFRPELVHAFSQLCHDSKLVRLHLSSFINVPPRVLHCSRIKHLKICRVLLSGEDEVTRLPESVRDYSDPGVLNAVTMASRESVFLESLYTDHSAPLLELIDVSDIGNLHPQLAFSRLVKLTSHITDNQDFHKTQWILSNAASTLTALEVELSSYNDMLAPSWNNDMAGDFMDLSVNSSPSLTIPSALRSVSINQQAPSFPVPLKSSIPAVCKVMNQIKAHPFIEDVDISLDLFSEHHELEPLDVFNGHDLSPLDKFFGRSGFSRLKKLTIRLAYYFQVNEGEIVDAEWLRNEGVRCVRDAFVETGKSPIGTRLHFDIHVYPVT